MLSNNSKTVRLGSQGLEVSRLGLGCMGMTAFYGGKTYKRAENDEENIKTIGKALELGINFFDTAYIYQSYGVDGEPNQTNEELLGKAIKRYGREKFVVATKFGVAFGPSGSIISGKEDLIRSQLNESLQRLDIECIDLYYMHRMDPTTPIEETIKVLKKLIEEGKIKYIGLSECTPSELERAHAIHPITAVQIEWSLQTRDVEDAVVPTARKLGVGIVPYSPLGRGLLTGAIKSLSELDEKDWRKSTPRWQQDSFEKNSGNEAFFEIAKRKGCTPAQLALGWVIAQGGDVVPIPGTKSAQRLEENFGSIAVADSLSLADIAEISTSVNVVVGERYEGIYFLINSIGMWGTFNTRL